MKKALATVLAAACLFTATACNAKPGKDTGELKNYDGNIIIPSETEITYEIGKANAHLYDGVGYQWDKHMFTDTAAIAEFDDSDFKELLKYVDASRFHRIRIHVSSSFFELRNDNDDPDVFQYEGQQPYNVNFNSDEMRALYKQLDACQTYGIRVTLSFMGPSRGTWNSDGMTKPKSDAEYAEGVSVMFRWLWKCGYTVCDELVIYPECEDLYHNKDNAFVFSEYEATVRAVDEKLRKDGIRDKIRFTGPADNHNLNTLLTCVEELDDVYDCYSSSYYYFSSEDSEEKMEEKLNQRMPQIGEAADWCSYFSKKQISGYDDTKVKIKCDDCNPFAVAAGDFGDVSGLSKHDKSVPSSTVAAFETLGKSFAAFMSNFIIPADGTNYAPKVEGDALSGYTEFYNKAIEIYNGSKYSFTRSEGDNLSRSAVIGLNKSYTMTFGNELSAEIDYQTAIARLFGYESKTDLIENAKKLAATYSQYRTGSSEYVSVNGALENGCFYTENGSFVFPMVVKNEYSPAVLSYVIIDSEGLVSVWVNDVAVALKVTNFNKDYNEGKSVNNKIYCKNVLFVNSPAGKSYKYAEYKNAGSYAKWEETREEFSTGLFLGRFFANSLNNGVTGMSLWTLADIPYGGIWMKTGQIKRDLDTHEWKALPEWYAYTLISRYTRRDSKIYTLKDDKDFFETTALCSPNGNWTYVTANETDDDITISIVNKEANYPYAMRCYVYKEDTLPVENELRITDYTVINTYKRVMTIKVPANSMMVITNLPD